MTSNKHSARWLLLQENFGVLSTISVDVPGYPFGSVTPYCVDRDCQPIIYISTIAQHTKNIMADSRVSLTIVESNADSDDVQARGRLTLLADAKVVGRRETDVVDRYMRHFPSAIPYDQTHGFMFFRLELVRARFIGGFGQIFWMTRDELCLKNPFSPQEETGIIQDMNNEHGIPLSGIDAEGFDVLQNGKKRRFPFNSPVRTVAEARQALADTVMRSVL